MYALTVPGERTSVAVISAFIWAVAQDAQLSRLKAYRLRLAVDEIVTNIISYGYGDCRPCGAIHVWAEINPTSVSVTIEDCGTPFDLTTQPVPRTLHAPLAERDLGGLGIYLVTQVVDSITYERTNSHNINRLTLERDT